MSLISDTMSRPLLLAFILTQATAMVPVLQEVETDNLSIIAALFLPRASFPKPRACKIDSLMLPSLEKKSMKNRIIQIETIRGWTEQRCYCRNNHTGEQMEPLVSPLNMTHKSRPKRGLLNIVGEFQARLFGVATEKSVSDLGKHLTTMVEETDQEVLALEEDLGKINEILDQTLKIVTEIEIQFSQINRTLNTLRVEEYLQSLYDYYLLEYLECSEMIRDLQLLQMGIVRFTWDQMNMIVREGERRLNASFPVKINQENYFRLTLPVLFDASSPISFITVFPFVRNSSWEVKRLYPFPFYYKGKVFIIANLPKYVAVEKSTPKTVRALHNLDGCIHLKFFGTSLCPFRDFESDLHPSSLCAKTAMAGDPLYRCVLQQFSSRMPYAVVIEETHYVFFPTKTTVFSHCKYSNSVIGLVKIPKQCDFYSENYTVASSPKIDHMDISYPGKIAMLPTLELTDADVAFSNEIIHVSDPFIEMNNHINKIRGEIGKHKNLHILHRKERTWNFSWSIVALIMGVILLLMLLLALCWWKAGRRTPIHDLVELETVRAMRSAEPRHKDKETLEMMREIAEIELMKVQAGLPRAVRERTNSL